MTISLDLVRLEGEPPEATLTWDEETGELTGPLADTVISMAQAAHAEGSVVTHPYPTEYPIEADPLRDRTALALVLSLRWLVPEPLQDAWPATDEDEESDVEALH